MHELSLFTGAGGGLLGTHLLGWRPVCAVEIEPYCREVLLRRQRDGVLPLFPIWDDVRTFDGRPWRGLVDVVTSGFPCQPFSVAGKGLGIDDPRNMWPDTIRIIRDVGPRFCLLENVPGLLAHEYFGTILGDLVASGFRVRWDCFSAASVGAPHRRDRLWIVADAASYDRRLHARQRSKRPGAAESSGTGETMADTDEAGLEGRDSRIMRERPGQRTTWPRCTWWNADPADVADTECGGQQEERDKGQHGKTQGQWETGGPWSNGRGARPDSREPKPRLGRVAHGVAHRVHRLKALGNGQVPAVVVRAWEALTS